MKKIIYTLLVAVLALSFMGCPSVYEDLKFEENVPTPAYIQGDFASKAVEMKVDGGVATYTFKYSVKDHNAWNSEPGTVKFKVSPEIAGDSLNWNLAWSNAKLTLNGEAVVVTEQNTSDISCSGLADGEEYTIKVTADVKSVKIEVTGKEGAAAPVLYVIDSSKGPVKMGYDGTVYKYVVIAKDTSIELPVWTEEKFLTGIFTVGTDNSAKTLTIKDDFGVISIKGTEANYKYNVEVTYDGEKATVKVTKGALVKKVDLKGITGTITGGVWTPFEEGNLVYEFTYNGNPDNWDSDAPNQVSFKVSVSATENWEVDNYGGVDVTVGAEAVELKKNPDMANGKIKGLVKDKKYKVTFVCTDDEKVTAKCEIVE